MKQPMGTCPICGRNEDERHADRGCPRCERCRCVLHIDWTSEHLPKSEAPGCRPCYRLEVAELALVESEDACLDPGANLRKILEAKLAEAQESERELLRGGPECAGRAEQAGKMACRIAALIGGASALERGAGS
jgi:hypothetical protein